MNGANSKCGSRFLMIFLKINLKTNNFYCLISIRIFDEGLCQNKKLRRV